MVPCCHCAIRVARKHDFFLWINEASVNGTKEGIATVFLKILYMITWKFPLQKRKYPPTPVAIQKHSAPSASTKQGGVQLRMW